MQSPCRRAGLPNGQRRPDTMRRDPSSIVRVFVQGRPAPINASISAATRADTRSAATVPDGLVYGRSLRHWKGTDMVIERFVTPELALVAYAVGDDAAGEVALIDPRRDVGVYAEWADRRGLTIVAVLETHIHADFVSGVL